MKKVRIIPTIFALLLVIGGAVGCKSTYHSSFADQAVKPVDLVKLNYRALKAGAVGDSTGFTFIWIPFASPSDGEAKKDMLDRLRKEGIETNGKNIGFTNVTADKGGFGIIGIIGAPTITLTADVIEILSGQQPQQIPPPAQPASSPTQPAP
jgi:hypothetical protein